MGLSHHAQELAGTSRIGEHCAGKCEVAAAAAAWGSVEFEQSAKGAGCGVGREGGGGGRTQFDDEGGGGGGKLGVAEEGEGVNKPM